MAKKKPDSDNNQNQAILEKLIELTERMADLEDAAQKGDNAAKIQLANMYFKPETQYLPDMSFISPVAAKPLAEAMALDMMTDEKVRSGEISLNMALINYWLHIQRGVKGRLLGLGAEAMKEQVSSEAGGQEEMPEYEAGRD